MLSGLSSPSVLVDTALTAVIEAEARLDVAWNQLPYGEPMCYIICWGRSWHGLPFKGQPRDPLEGGSCRSALLAPAPFTEHWQQALQQPK